MREWRRRRFPGESGGEGTATIRTVEVGCKRPWPARADDRRRVVRVFERQRAGALRCGSLLAIRLAPAWLERREVPLLRVGCRFAFAVVVFPSPAVLIGDVTPSEPGERPARHDPQGLLRVHAFRLDGAQVRPSVAEVELVDERLARLEPAELRLLLVERLDVTPVVVIVIGPADPCPVRELEHVEMGSVPAREGVVDRGSEGRRGPIDEVATRRYFGCMRAVGIKVLKNRLSEYIRLARAGETILVTDRDQVVAELGPPGGGRPKDSGDAALADLVRDGILSPPLRGSADPPVKPPPTMTLAELLRDLDEARADR